MAAPDRRPCCTRRLQLADAFATNARLYAEAVVVLTQHPTQTVQYEELCKRTIEAQTRAERASIAFEEHVAGHGC